MKECSAAVEHVIDHNHNASIQEAEVEIGAFHIRDTNRVVEWGVFV